MYVCIYICIHTHTHIHTTIRAFHLMFLTNFPTQDFAPRPHTLLHSIKPTAMFHVAIYSLECWRNDEIVFWHRKNCENAGFVDTNEKMERILSGIRNAFDKWAVTEWAIKWVAFILTSSSRLVKKQTHPGSHLDEIVTLCKWRAFSCALCTFVEWQLC